jgi:hypothetical protein
MRNLLIASLALFAVIVLPAAHCNPSAGWNAFVACEQPSIKNDLPQVLPLVIDILLSKGSDVAADAALVGLALKLGTELIECAIVAAVTALTTPPATQPTVWHAGTPTKDETARAISRGNAWLKTQGVTIGATP